MKNVYILYLYYNIFDFQYNTVMGNLLKLGKECNFVIDYLNHHCTFLWYFLGPLTFDGPLGIFTSTVEYSPKGVFPLKVYMSLGTVVVLLGNQRLYLLPLVIDTY